jgi:hypothetical protein
VVSSYKQNFLVKLWALISVNTSYIYKHASDKKHTGGSVVDTKRSWNKMIESHPLQHELIPVITDCAT